MNGTPAPWDVTPNQSAVYTDDGTIIAIMSDEIISIEESAANAHLIAAAPELLEAAKTAKKLCDLLTQWAAAENEEASDLMDEIIALAQDNNQPQEAISKAHGEKS